MCTETSFWPELWSGFVGVIVGSFIPIGTAWWARRKELRGELDAMQAELRRAHLCMSALRNDEPRILAPLYRLPLTMFGIALPKIIGDGRLTLNETGALLEFVMRAEELNRGLDRAGEAHAAAAWERLEDEYKRNVEKVRHILDVPDKRFGGDTLFDAAQRALFRIERRRWFGRKRAS